MVKTHLWRRPAWAAGRVIRQRWLGRASRVQGMAQRRSHERTHVSEAALLYPRLQFTGSRPESDPLLTVTSKYRAGLVWILHWPTTGAWSV